jgi:hypothetical protein
VALEQSRRNRSALWIVAALFFLSGVAALVNETVWSRWLALALGSSARGTVVVLCVFMAGLGAGSLWAGSIADRRPERALLWFAWCCPSSWPLPSKKRYPGRREAVGDAMARRFFKE